MRKIGYCVTFLLVSYAATLCAQQGNASFPVEDLYCLPAIENPASLVVRDHYILHYNEEFEQPDWVAYQLTVDEALGETARKDAFRPDPDIQTGSADLEDYRGSGYDRGHLAPAADMKMSPESMAQSFYMSNMSPQIPGLNRRIWAELESWIRTWAAENRAVFIVTGPILTAADYPRIGPNRVAVPEFFFKVILDYREPEFKAIGFILPNRAVEQPLETFACTVDTVEEKSGLNFFALLPSDLQEELESQLNPALWPGERFQQERYLETELE